MKGDNTAAKKFRFSYAAVQNPADATVDKDGQGATNFTDQATTLDLEINIESGVPSEDQNAIVKSLRDQGFTVSAEVVDDGAGSPTLSYSLNLNGEIAKNYTVNYAGNGEFEIVNAKGTKIVTATVSGGNLPRNDLATDLGKKQSAIITASSVTAATVEDEPVRFYDKDGNAISSNALKDYFTARDDNGTITIYPKTGTKIYDAVGNVLDAATKINDADISAVQNLVGDLKLKLHVGADATKNNQITINLQAMSAKGLGVNGLKVNGNDDSNALDAIETIKSALSTVSAQRSELGAAQNRLEHTIANLDNIVENTTSAESAIRDTDMAEEMVKYSKSNILAQAGQSMLAQANQSNQGVLSLLG